MFGLQFSRIVIYLQLCHIQNCKYNPFTFCNLFPLILLNLYTLLNIIFKDILFSIDYLIYFCFLFNLISWFHLVYFSSEELCNILNIKRFSLKKIIKRKIKYNIKKLKKNNKLIIYKFFHNKINKY